MNVIKMSDVVESIDVKSLGEPVGYSKFTEVHTPVIIKSNGKYELRRTQVPIIVCLEYEYKSTRIQLGISDSPSCMYLFGIEVSPNKRGFGIGTEIMNIILDHCDANGLDLKLQPFPTEWSQDPLKYGLKKILPKYYRLKSWYEDFGFEMTRNFDMIYKHQ